MACLSVKIKMKLLKNKFIKVKESRIATFGLYQFWPFVFLVHLLLLRNVRSFFSVGGVAEIYF